MTLYYNHDLIKANNLAQILDNDPFYSNPANRELVYFARPSDGFDFLESENFGWRPDLIYKEPTIPTLIGRDADIVNNWEGHGLSCAKDRRGFPRIAKMFPLTNVREFLISHNLPLPTALFPDEDNNTVDNYFRLLSENCNFNDECIKEVEGQKRKALLICKFFYHAEIVHREDYREYEIVEPIAPPEAIAENRVEALENILNLKEAASEQELSIISNWISDYLETMPSFSMWEQLVEKRRLEKELENWAPLIPKSIEEATKKENMLSNIREKLRCLNEGLPAPDIFETQDIPSTISLLQQRFCEITTEIISCLKLTPEPKTRRFPIITNKERLHNLLEQYKSLSDTVSLFVIHSKTEDKKYGADLLVCTILFNYFLCNRDAARQIKYYMKNGLPGPENTGSLSSVDIYDFIQDYNEVGIAYLKNDAILTHYKADPAIEIDHCDVVLEFIASCCYTIDDFKMAALRFVDWRDGKLARPEECSILNIAEGVSSLVTKDCPAERDLNNTQDAPKGISIESPIPSPHRGRKSTLDNMECIKIYRLHYQEGKKIEAIAKEYNWLNSPFADSPKFETAKSRINKALVRGRELTPHHARPTNDKAGRA